MILQPLNSFTVVRQISDHTDVNTYYVRAVIRNAYTDVIITTLDLEDKTGQRFKKDWQVTADTSGQGFYISIVTSVYTDSGYTTKSANYGDEENTYLVQERVLGNRGGGGGVDMRGLRIVIQEEIAKIPKPQVVTIDEIRNILPIQKEYDMRWDDILKGLSEIKKNISSIPQTNLFPIVSKLDEVISSIKNKEVTPATDLSPILDKLSENKDTDDLNAGEIKDILSTMQNDFIDKMSSKLKEIIQKTNFMTSFVTHAHPSDIEIKKEEIKKEEQPPFDITKLTQ